MSDELTAVVTLLPMGLLWTILGIPLILGRVPRNGLYGFRVPSTLSDDRVWYPVNRSTGWFMVSNGVVILAIVCAATLDFFRISLVVVLLLIATSMLVGVGLGILQARRIKSRLR